MNDSVKINWSDRLAWQKSIISTIICLICCSIGTLGVAIYFINSYWPFVLIASLIAGLISSMLFMTFWEIVFHKLNLLDAIKHSYKMSVFPILIMIISENLIMLFIIPKFSSHQMHMNTSHGFKIMLLAMSFGFVVSLPYCYYQLKKTGKIHH